MARQFPSEKGRPVPQAVALQSMLQQAQAAADTQTDYSATSTRRDALLQEVNLITPDAAVDDLAPPAYGEVHGEIRDEKNGLGASVTDDGRVNIPYQPA
jgi:hypothetical protein